MQSTLRNYVIAGNPGVGKSTFLNGLLGEPKFASGTTDGEGKTTEVQIETKKDGTKLIDAPGLADINIVADHAKQIAKALEAGGDNTVLVFIITLESMRVRSGDLITMRLILEATKVKSHQYAVVINKLNKKSLQQLKENPDNYNKVFVALNKSLPAKTSHIYLYPHEKVLNDEDDCVPDSPEFRDLQKFLQNCPTTKIGKVDPNMIRVNNWEEAENIASQFISDLHKETGESLESMKIEIDREIVRAKEDYERQKKKENSPPRNNNRQLIHAKKETKKEAGCNLY